MDRIRQFPAGSPDLVSRARIASPRRSWPLPPDRVSLNVHSSLLPAYAGHGGGTSTRSGTTIPSRESRSTRWSIDSMPGGSCASSGSRSTPRCPCSSCFATSACGEPRCSRRRSTRWRNDRPHRRVTPGTSPSEPGSARPTRDDIRVLRRRGFRLMGVPRPRRAGPTATPRIARSGRARVTASEPFLPFAFPRRRRGRDRRGRRHPPLGAGSRRARRRSSFEDDFRGVPRRRGRMHRGQLRHGGAPSRARGDGASAPGDEVIVPTHTFHRHRRGRRIPPGSAGVRRHRPRQPTAYRRPPSSER